METPDEEKGRKGEKEKGRRNQYIPPFLPSSFTPVLYNDGFPRHWDLVKSVFVRQ